MSQPPIYDEPETNYYYNDTEAPPSYENHGYDIHRPTYMDLDKNRYEDVETNQAIIHRGNAIPMRDLGTSKVQTGLFLNLLLH